MTHSYGPHDPSTAPTTITVGAGSNEHPVPPHPALVRQREQLNSIAAGQSAKSSVLAAVNSAAPDDVKARIDAAIMRVARRGGVFSANDFRDDFPESGGVVGARVAVLARQFFTHVGYVPSSKGSTHGHEIKTWRIREAAAA